MQYTYICMVVSTIVCIRWHNTCYVRMLAFSKGLIMVQSWSKNREKLSSSNRLHLVLIRKSTVLKVNNDLLSGCLTQTQGSRSGRNSVVAILGRTTAALKGKTNSIIEPCVVFSFHPGCLRNLALTPWISNWSGCLKMGPRKHGASVSVADREMFPFHFVTFGRSLVQLLGQLVQAAADFLPVSSGPLALDTRWELINTVSTQLRVTTLRKRNSTLFSSSH